MTEYDVVVIGAGPGGYVAAIRAAQLGKKVAVVEKEHLGGVCLNWGCIPTKALLKAGEIKTMIAHAAQFGINVPEVTVDFGKMIDRSRAVAKQLSQGIAHLMKKNKITVIMGTAALEGGKTVRVETLAGTQKLKAGSVILATGARARRLPGLETAHERVWTAREAMLPPFQPKSLLIIGSGAIGIEFASFYNAVGTKVTVVEMQPRILPAEDHEIAALAQKRFAAQGVILHVNASAQITPAADHVAATIASAGKVIEEGKYDAAIMAIGIVPNSGHIGLESTKIKTDRGFVVTDGYGRTDEPGVYAIGDLTAGPWLAHKASHEGIIAAEHICGVQNIHPLERTGIPGCTYSNPQIASVGITEAQAAEQKLKVRIGRFPFKANGKALAMGEPEGLIKLIFDEGNGALLGAHLIGAEATEMIHSLTLAKTLETTEAELMHTVFPHPTLSEMLHEATLDAYGRAIHF